MPDAKVLDEMRRDYRLIVPDYTIKHDWAAYIQSEHSVWRELYLRQSSLVQRYACDPFLAELERLHIADAVPDFARVMRPDFGPLYDRLADRPVLAAGALVDGDRKIPH